MTLRIPLTQGKVALVDDEDFERVNQFKWYADHINNKWYAVRQPGTRATRTTILLHRFILNAPTGMEVDHWNGDGLDCQRSNLRICSHRQNGYNQPKSSRNTSGYKGVSWFKRDQNWVAYICIDGRSKNLGYYDTPEDAARAYDDAAREHFGEFAYTNFGTHSTP